METTLKSVSRSRLKIAVLHHNPTSVPSGDIDQFDVLVNAGVLKQMLSQCGFDVVLYGHRHLLHCSLEKLRSSGVNPQEAQLSDGVLFLAGDSLGCPETAPFLELSIKDLPAHRSESPVCLLSVYSWEHNGIHYTKDNAPVVQSILSTPIYRALDRVARNIGRQKPLTTDMAELPHAIDIVLPPIEELRSRLVDWSSDGVR